MNRFANINGPATVVESFTNSIQIGAFSSIGMGCVLIDYNHRYKCASTFCINHTFFDKPYVYDLEAKGDIIIEEDVWIGANVVIMGGIKIGRGSIIGSGSIVRQDIPRYSIAAGNPARVIKSRFTDKVIRELEDTQWFLWSEQEIREREDFFNKDYL